MELQFFDDPSRFLEVAGDALAEQPVLSTVIAGVAERIAQRRADGVPWPPGIPCWFAVVCDHGAIAGAAMRTASFGAYPAYLLPMPDEAARLLAQSLLARDEIVLAANGALPAVRTFCDEMARATDRITDVAQHTRLFELTRVIEPRPVEGRLRTATPDELELVASWYDAFMADADEQAGREPGVSAHETPEADELQRRIETGRIFLWDDGTGAAVNLTAASMPSYGVSRIGPVYTPREHRGRGYASAAVAAASAFLLEHGERPCLFTDQANPTSNRIYEAVGYERVVDMANLVVV
jgi:predicted GNAT family acetyltransferase